jgi:hypothetical protein
MKLRAVTAAKAINRGRVIQWPGSECCGQKELQPGGLPIQAEKSLSLDPAGKSSALRLEGDPCNDVPRR